jgi:type IV secretion system protein VirB2
MLSLFATAVVMPDVAFAQSTGAGPWTGTLNYVVSILTGAPARLLAIIAISALGVIALLGRMSWSWAGSIIGGVVLIFGAASIADLFISSVGG